MLDAETKARIDSARDILVGKVPDPKSQVEQITIALIYKFMDDMDRQSEELGGKASFFTGEFRRYAWNKLMDPRLGGHERLNLYAEGIEKMNENRNIPQLFRDIFRGVFLPYRDPQTLHLFLKEVDGFSYDHSERLGDAYEYLLAVLGSQGEAGQFRTPRHLIDFIVAVVDPQKRETVLDPACGTAGFLISSFKHILAQNTKDRPGDQLSADERGRLMTNFCGYDIAPDMVRLSRVNMYLHGFANPRIHEYDTLTTEERWDERYDVILANPPFMTPKGGIRPHNRFAIKATRSEVLFVDYIAEHLNVNGRAGVIVPEGIIFQSQNAYKKLRTMLVESYLWCVVSLPAGCFNPYSGVKTSILFLDKSLAKRTDEILFVKVENDGFDLGAQRRPIDRNDLPPALEAIQVWRNGSKQPQGQLAHAVSRKRILDSLDCGLSGDRYRAASVGVSTRWPMVRLSEVATINRESCDPSSCYGENTFVYLDISCVENGTGRISLGNRVKGTEAPSRAKRAIRQGDILLSTVRPNLQAIAYLESVPQDAVASTGFAVLSPESEKVNGRFLYSLLFSEPVMRQLVSRMGKGAYPSVTQDDVTAIEFPLPPIEVQERIAAELDGYRRIIEGAKQVIGNYKPTIRLDPDWPIEELGRICQMEYGYTASAQDIGDTRFVRITDINADGTLSNQDPKFIEMSDDARPYLLKKGDVLLARTGATYGKALLYRGDEQAVFASYLIRLLFDARVDTGFFWAFAQSGAYWSQAREQAAGGAQPQFNANAIKRLRIPLPPIDVQRQIVAEIEAERTLVESNRKLVDIFEKKIQAKLAEIWGEASE